MAQRRRTGLDKQSSAYPIILGAIAVAAVLGLIGGVVWGLASSGNPTPSPSASPIPTTTSATPTTASATPTPTTTSASPTPTTTSASPTSTTASPTPTATPTTPGGVPPAPATDQLNSNQWSLNHYQFVNVGGNFGMTANVANQAIKPRSGHFTVYLYVSGKYVGTLFASVTNELPSLVGSGTPVTFTSNDKYAQGGKVVLFVASP
jgi:hypothetical protein